MSLLLHGNPSIVPDVQANSTHTVARLGLRWPLHLRLLQADLHDYCQCFNAGELDLIECLAIKIRYITRSI
jgi:hypothetical protein